MYTVYTFKQPFNKNMLRKIAQNRITQKQNIAILCEIKIANNCAKCYFFAQKWSAKKVEICVFLRKSFVNGNPNTLIYLYKYKL